MQIFYTPIYIAIRNAHMSKYQPLWEYISSRNEPALKLDFSEIEDVLKAPIDHSFLTYKKEL